LELLGYCTSGVYFTHVDELNSPVQDSDETLENTKRNVGSDVSRICFLLSCNAACLSEHVDDCNDQASQTDTSKTVGQRASGSAAGDVLGGVVRAEVPRTIDSRNDDMDHVLEELGDPIHRERDEDEQTNDLGL
jgi:hypothetical protein